jgi:hypothetical protein
MSSMVRSLAAALALTVLTGGAAQALPRDSRQEPAAARVRLVWLDAAWEWLASRLLSGRPAGEKEGGMMDPNGAVVSLDASVEIGLGLAFFGRDDH